MIRFPVALLALTSPALAHVGHIGEAAGHGHWIGAIALGAAAAITLAAVLKGRKKEEAEPEGEEVEEDEEAEA